ncbi:hypothetical protein RN001_000598 [Aquatica leii]|uniref:PH domain-containing protein n=1 Tax=Aquatica leii TaxID=1421715 RepID=A0AAN7SJ75_9COLE|nr:hypothetical protein RN001_000598 [Aquatica leii]
MSGNEVVSGYLDVKVSARSRRGFTPWKAWHKQWCEIKRLDSVENGAKLILKTAADGSIINSVTLPRSSTVCRIESTTKNFAFGVFTLGRNQKPILFLSGSCEKDTQKWMSLIRKALAIASYLPVGSLNFHISLVDNDHSRAARLTGLFGILSVTSQEICISDPITGDDLIKWSWYNFHQFHLQATLNSEDENTICVLHTSKEFVSGAGQIYLFCEDASELLEVLVTHGKSRKLNPLFAATQRLSQSESDLSKSNDGYHSLRHFSNSDDSGVRVSISSDDSDSRVKTKTLSMNGLLSKTPGGSEAEDDDTESNFNTQLYNKSRIPRGESGISLASGVYEEIPEFVPDLKTNTPCNVYSNGHMMHLYEDPEELSTSILLKTGKCIPPPLPPRIYSKLENNCDIDKMKNISTPECLLKSFSGNACNLQKFRSHTLPAKDLRRLSQTFSSDSDYMVMTPKNKKKCKNNMSESVYVPMSPITSLKTKLENCYMVMSGKKC